MQYVVTHWMWTMVRKRDARLNTVIEQGLSGGYFIYDPEAGQHSFAPDSASWFTWLAGRSSFSFTCEGGHFTARCEKRARGKQTKHPDHERAYWYAYRRAHGRLYKRYLGTTGKLTLPLLEETARAFHNEIVSNLPISQLLTKRNEQKPLPPVLRVGTLTFAYDEGVLSVKTPSEHHYLTRIQAAELLRYLYDQQQHLLRK